MAEETIPYPVELDIDYPDRKLNRWTTFFRIILVIPVFILLVSISGSHEGFRGHHLESVWGAGGILVIPILLMILFRGKYPRWWFDWNVALMSFSLRVIVYLAFLRDEYPSTDEEQAVHLKVAYPDAKVDLMRGMPLVKWFLAIPHYVVLACLIVAVVVLSIFAWFAILFAGRYPRWVFDFVVGVLRWETRVAAYAFLLTTDRYPPFRLIEQK